MKKSIFLFFAAILCAMNVNAWSLMGEVTDWSTGKEMTGDSKVVSVTVSLQANKTLKLKIKNGSTWYGNGGTMTSANNLAWEFSDQAGDASIKTTDAGDYTFTWYISDKKLSVTYPNHNYIIAGEGDVLEDAWAPSSNKNKMTKQDDGTYSLTKTNRTLQATTYYYKLTVGSWDVNQYPSSNVELKVTKAGIYNVVFTYNPKNGTLSHELIPAKCYLMGNGDWTNGVEMIPNPEKDNEFILLDYSINAPFKFKYADTWTDEVENYDKNGVSWVDGNIVLPAGNYDFYFKKDIMKVYIARNTVVTTTANPAEGGTLTGAGVYNNNDDVTLTATPNTGYNFVNWTKGGTQVSTDATYAFKAAGDVELVANFELKTYTVKFLNYDGEVLQSSTVNHGETPVYSGKTPERPADAQYTYTFSGWDNAIAAATSDQTYKAQFNTTVNQYTITVNTENGTVTGAGTYDYGTNVTLTATANDGYEFVNWTKAGEEVSTEATYSLTVTENVVLVANFEKILIEIGDGDNREVLNTYKNQTVDVKVNRTFKANDGYYTICLPFDLPASKIGTAYQVTSITEHVADQGFYMVFDEVQNLEAGQPYLILPNDLTNPTFEDVTITYTDNGKSVAASGAGINFKMVGVINGGGQTEVGQYWVGDNGYFYNGDGTGTTAKLGLRVLFNITDNAGTPVKIRARVVLGENAATSLDNITNGENTTIKVIENGQLIIIRDGEKFNAQGVRF